MLMRVKQTVAEMKQAEIARRNHCAFDPFEQARLALQRRGVVIYAHSVHKPGSDLFVVGQRTMTKNEVIEHSIRFCR